MANGSISPNALSIGIAGAGLLGRLLAWQAVQAGHAVTVFDPAPHALASFDGHGAAAFSAAGMLSPLAELDSASTQVARLGLRSMTLWPQILSTLPHAPYFNQQGSLLVAHRSDLGAAQRVLSRLDQAPSEMPRPVPLSGTELRRLEPALHDVAHAWLLPGEGQIDPPSTLTALHDQGRQAGVQWRWGCKVSHLTPHALWVSGQPAAHNFDLVFDVRGLGARGTTQTTPCAQESATSESLRGVRGETIWLYAPGHGLSRPVRLLHPRYRVYLVPRPFDTLVIGASEIESEDRGAVSLRSAVELMSAAYSILPALAEARIQRLDANLRPAHPDNEPHVQAEPGLIRITGLYRHGWLLAPALIERALTLLNLPWLHVNAAPDAVTSS